MSVPLNYGVVGGGIDLWYVDVYYPIGETQPAAVIPNGAVPHYEHPWTATDPGSAQADPQSIPVNAQIWGCEHHLNFTYGTGAPSWGPGGSYKGSPYDASVGGMGGGWLRCTGVMDSFGRGTATPPNPPFNRASDVFGPYFTWNAMGFCSSTAGCPRSALTCNQARLRVIFYYPTGQAAIWSDGTDPDPDDPPPPPPPPPPDPEPEEPPKPGPAPVPTPSGDCKCPPPGGFPSSPNGQNTDVQPNPNPTPDPAGGDPIPGVPPLGGPAAPCANSGGEAMEYPSALPAGIFEGSRDASMFVRIANYDFSADAPAPFAMAVGQPIPDPADFQEGFKRGVIAEISQVSRSMSNEQGDYVGSQVNFTSDDTDRTIRNLLASPGKKHLYGREASVCVYPTEAHRIARQAPIILMRGVVRNYPLGRRLRSMFALEDLFASDFGAFGPGRTISDRKLTRGLFPFIAPEKVGLTQPIIGGEVSDRQFFSMVDGSQITRGLAPLIDVGTAVIGGVEYLDCFLCGHAIVGIDICARDDSNGYRVPVPNSAYGADILAPGRTGWPFANKYFDLTDSDTGEVHRVTRVFVRLASAYAQSHLLNQIKMAANVCGMDEIGDGTGRVVTDYFHLMQMIVDNWILRSPGYFTGNYLGAPAWEDGTYMTHSDSFRAAQAITQKFIGGRGYQGSFMIRDRLLTREVMKRFFVTAHCGGFWSREGQYRIDVPDDTISISSLPMVREPVMVRAGIVPDFDVSQVENPVVYSFLRDYDKNVWRADQKEVIDPEAKRLVGRFRPSPDPIECWMSADEKTVRDAMTRRLIWRRYPVRPVEIEMPIDGMDFEIGQTIRANSYDGIGSGYVNAPVRLLSVTYNHRARRAVWKGMETSQILQEGIVMQEDADASVLMSTDPGSLQLR